MAQGSPRAHIVSALLAVGIEITPHQLSNVIARLRRQREGAPSQAARAPAKRLYAGAQGEMRDAPGLLPVAAAPRIASVPTLMPALPVVAAASRVPKYGAHDPRLLDAVMRSTPDMKAFAKLAPKSTTQGKP